MVEIGKLTEPADPINSLLQRQGFLVLDGGLATQLEARGCDLGDELWSARILLEAPDLIRQVHVDYLRAGADCIVSASYQATVPGFMKRGVSQRDARDLLRASVELAVETRDRFWEDLSNRTHRLRPLVAAGVGPYGAYLADGSEYTGDYDLDENGLYEFHRDRWDELVCSGSDLVACETIPSLPEVRSLVRLLGESPSAVAWISLSCTDAQHLRDGASLMEAVREAVSVEQVAAVGVNCVPPAVVKDLIRQLSALTDKPLVVYPNSGEGWDASNKKWTGSAAAVDFGDAAAEWFALGARLIGGCCRTGPGDIGRIRQSLIRQPK
jgi:homocysteine S-methyltransferase